MNEEDKIRLLKMAISCLRKPGETKPVFSNDIPTKEEIDIIKKSLENEKVDEILLKKFFPMAYEGVNKHGFFEYFFFVHNDLIRKLERYTKDKLFDWCTAYPAKIVDKVDSKYVVETVDGRIIKTDSEAYPGIIVEKQLKIGDLIILHRDKIHIVLNKENFEIVSKLHKKFKEKKTK
jgi:hypothetical protein